MTRLVMLSDTHGMHHKVSVPDGDILVHAGDFCGHGLWPEFKDFVEWLRDLPHGRKVVTPGNHDWVCEQNEEACLGLAAENGIDLLVHGPVQIGDLWFWGSPYTPTFCNWYFMRDRGEQIEREWDQIPDVDVLVTHGPPYGHGDLVPPWRGQPRRNAGCLELLKALCRIQPKVHVFGHIHDGHGKTVSDEFPNTVFVNASICTEEYKPTNPCQVLDL